MANRWGHSGNSGWLYILRLQNHCRWWLQPWNQKTLAPWKKSYDQLRQHVKKKSCAFELWCWRRLLRVPWTARRSNQSSLKEIAPEYSSEGLIGWNSNSLATWCEELTHWERPWCWERLRAGEGADKGWDGWMASPTPWTWVWAKSGRWWRTGKPGVLQSVGSQSIKRWLVCFCVYRDGTRCFGFQDKMIKHCDST